ncbi:putative plakophilin-1 [Triplophysa rosa]|uniref:Plakophilin-1 n=2 Tax=Triplophysa rosa TaxID=992332 RepID=A0A9W7WTH0_TRIRA|nr:putative plakophilin-1 [Triplophysa rosa]
MPEPFKSALSLGHVEDTSLALPSDHQMRSAQQRVLDQVCTIKRSKSKYSSKSVSGLPSPTSPESDSVFYDFKLSSASALSGPSINRGNTMTNGAKQRQNFVRKSMNSRNSSSAHMSMSSRKEGPLYAPVKTLPTQPQPNSLYVSKGTRSAPDLGFYSTANGGTAQRSQAGMGRYSSEWAEKTMAHPLYKQTHQAVANGTYGRTVSMNRVSTVQPVKRRTSSLQSNGDSRMSIPKTGQTGGYAMNTERLMSDMTMKEAVECLFSPDENHQLCGAAYIQHSTFTDEKAKQEVLTLKGIPPLIDLLNSPSPRIHETAAAALRNAIFKNQPNKDEVHRAGGIPKVVQLLGESSDETHKHLTGLLWNLSSADHIKPDLLRTALPALTEKVLEPYSSSTDQTMVSPEVLLNTTACLRNLSSSKLANRQAMRNCKGLIDSLMRYTETCINNDTPDNQALENCVCILHNLTYQLETEMPSAFTKMNALASHARKRTSSSEAGPIGCFSSQSQKVQQENVFDYPVMEDNNPKGLSWLFHSKALQMYLDLLSSSDRDATLEASCGALQNLTANDGIVSNVLSHTVVHKLNGLKHISPLVQSTNPALQNSAIALLGNLSRSTRTGNRNMARQSLPQLVGFVNSGLTKNDSTPQFDGTMATALHSAHSMLKADPELGKSLINPGLISGLSGMSRNMISLPKSSTAAGVLLHSLWSDKSFQSFLKTQGMDKKTFVNDATSAAFRSLQVID